MSMESRRCVDFTAHIPHRWSPDRGLNYFKCPGLDAMTAALISKDVADGRESDCGNFIHHPRHPWTETREGYNNHHVCPGVPSTPPVNFDRVVMRWPCDDRTVHESHDYQRPSDGTWHHCPGLFGTSIGEIAVPEDSAQVIQVVSPPAWKYHVDTYPKVGEPGKCFYQVVKKRGESSSGQLVAQYNNAVYARIVADALNGGVVLGFEEEL